MISTKDIKWLRSLQLKKNRDKEKCFIIEGEKLVKEALKSQVNVRQIYALENTDLNYDYQKVSSSELTRISSQKQPHNAIAVLDYFEVKKMEPCGVLIVLDGVRDPGNLGTIIRTANWFGVKSIICSNDCVDLYNPKLLRASMGAVFNVSVIYTDLQRWLESYDHDAYVMDMEGESLFSKEFAQQDFAVIFGNEANGVREVIRDQANYKLTIPGVNQQESLNVGVAATMTMAELFRRSLL